MPQNLLNRVAKLETEVDALDQPIMIASMGPDGSIEWNGQMFQDEQEFDAALASIKTSSPLIIVD